MKIIILSLLFLLACAPQTPMPQSPPGSKPAEKTLAHLPGNWDFHRIPSLQDGSEAKERLAILEISGDGRYPMNVKINTTDMLTTALNNTKRFELVERAQIEAILKEQRFGQSGLADQNTVVEIGNLLGAQMLLMGSVTHATRSDLDKFGYVLARLEVGIDLRLVDAETGQILLTEYAIGQQSHKIIRSADGTLVSGALDDGLAFSEAARDAVKKVAKKIAALSPAAGLVLSATAMPMLAAGSEDGLKIGDSVMIFRAGEEVRHPNSNELLMVKTTIIADGIVKQLHKKSCSVEIQTRQGQVVQPEDLFLQLSTN